MTRDAIRTALLQERAQWVSSRQAEGQNVHEDDVTFLSVTKLLHLVVSGSVPSEQLQLQHGIHVHMETIGNNDIGNHKHPRIESLTYSSSRAWITGILELDGNGIHGGGSGGGLSLRDASSRVHVVVVNPGTTLLGQLVLIRSWTWINGTSIESSFLEVHGSLVCLPSEASTHIQLADVEARLAQFYASHQDPPLYACDQSWRSFNVGHSISETRSSTGRRDRPRRIYVVFGRVTSVSPIAVQPVPSNSHFFVEVEHRVDGSSEQSIVYIMMAGVKALRYHFLIQPGNLLLTTDLKKVYSQECEVFLLQTSMNEDVDDRGLASELFVWPVRTPVQHSPHVQGGDANKTIDYDGIVTHLLYDECLVLEAGDKSKAVIALFHYPATEFLSFLRIDTRVRVSSVHVLGRSWIAGDEAWVLGLCPRSHISVIENAPSSSPRLIQNVSVSATTRRRSLKKWAIFGDFYRQPLDVSMAWLDLFHACVQKFQFGVSTSRYGCIRRREGVKRIGLALGLTSSTDTDPRRTPTTLARRFLNAHTAERRDCASVSACDLDHRYFVTVSALRERALEVARQLLIDNDATEWPIRVSSRHMNEFVLLANLSGNVDTCDLHVVDETGAIPCALLSDAKDLLKIDGACVVYWFKHFEVVIERLESSRDAPSLVPTIQVMQRDVMRLPLCSTHTLSNAIEGETITLLFVTHIDPLKHRHRLAAISKTPNRRHLHGVVLNITLRDGRWHLDTMSARCVEWLVATDAEVWFVQVHHWYRVHGAQSIGQPPVAPGNDVVAPKESRLIQWLHAVGNLDLSHDESESDVCSIRDNSIWESTLDLGEELHRLHTCVIDAPFSFVPVAFCSCADRSKCVCATSNRPTSIAPGSTRASMLLPIEAQSLSMSNRAVQVLSQLQSYAMSQSTIMRVRELFQHDLVVDTEPVDLHRARLISLVGLVTQCSLVEQQSQREPVHFTLGKRSRVDESALFDSQADWMCRLQIRDLTSLESTVIHIDELKFGAHAALRPGSVVEIAKILCFHARASYKPFLTWTHCTSVRVMDPMTLNMEPILNEAELYGAMPTTRLMVLYQELMMFDRTVRRFVVQVVHVSYVVMKRRCQQCRRALELDKRGGIWLHPDAENAKEGGFLKSRERGCSWRQLEHSSPRFTRMTYVSTSMRCIIDDGSAQCELFLENDVAWELLQCSSGRRRRFEDHVTTQTSELSHYAARGATTDSLFTTAAMQENVYYQNEWRAFIQDTVMNTTQSLIVYGQRFYSASKGSNEAPQTAVLTFGRDIQITTPTTPMVQIEGIRVDQVDARRELRRRLAERVRKHATPCTEISGAA